MGAKESVAIVDDEVDVLRTYELLFRRRDIPVSFVALDGPDAVEKFKSADPRPRIMIIDYRLPSMDGLQVMKEVLAVEPEMKVLFISGDDRIEEESLAAGASAFLAKPASLKAIMEAINRLMGE